MADQGKIVQPPKRLKDKVRRTGGPTPESAILRALNAAEDLMDTYQGWAVDDLAKLWQTFQGTGPSAPAKERITKMFDMTHDIRGEGGSFGFPLVSVIADSFCKFLEPRQKLGTAELEVVKVHILAMRAVFRQDLKGSQPTLEREMQQLLALLRDRMPVR